MKNKLTFLLVCLNLFFACKKEDALEKSLHSGNAFKLSFNLKYSTDPDWEKVYYFKTDTVQLIAPVDTAMCHYFWPHSNEMTKAVYILNPGIYKVRAIIKNNAKVHAGGQTYKTNDTIYFGINLLLKNSPNSLFFPSSFSPNEDNENDYWEPKATNVDKYLLKIYDYQNRLIFKTNDLTDYWDGKFKGTLMPLDKPYKYFIKVKFFPDGNNEGEEKSYEGFIRLFY